jgi:hypothetical protein
MNNRIIAMQWASRLSVVGLLFVAIWLRLDELTSRYPDAIRLIGDSLEYLQFTEFLLGERKGVPPNRFPGCLCY